LTLGLKWQATRTPAISRQFVSGTGLLALGDAASLFGSRWPLSYWSWSPWLRLCLFFRVEKSSTQMSNVPVLRNGTINSMQGTSVSALTFAKPA
jgi:hypothetical protein